MKSKRIKKYLPWVILALVAVFLAVLPAIARSRAEEAKVSILSANAETGELVNTLAGGGTLTAQEAEDVRLPTDVEVTRFLVSNGDLVQEGDPLAEIDRVSAMAAAIQVQEALDSLSQDLTTAAQEELALTITAPTAGRIKAVYAQRGDDVKTVMLRSGSLAVLSLDGLMALDLNNDAALTVGQSVTVRLSDGSEYPGRVDTVLVDKTVVTLTDDGPSLGDAAVVLDPDGQVLGSGQLYVHNAWDVIASSGTVVSVNAQEGGRVYKDYGLFTLSDMEHSAEYQQLAVQHRDYEELLTDLFRMYQDGVIKAPRTGYVSGVDKEIATNMSAQGSFTIQLLAEETEEPAFTYEIVLVTRVDEKGNLWGRTSPWPNDINDPAQLSILLASANAFLQNTEEVPVSIEGAEGLAGQPQPGDLFVISSNGEESQTIYVGNVGTALSSLPTDFTLPGSFAIPSFDLSGFDFSGFSFPGASTEEEEELFDLDGSTLCSITPNETMTITISVDELDILQYSTGMEAEITVDALPGQTFRGVVTEIGGVGANSGGSSKYDVELTLDRSPDMLDGMNTSVVVYKDSTTGLLIPTAALNNSGSRTYVYTVYDAKTKQLSAPVDVVTGASDGDLVEIVSGLTEGQPVWYAYYDSLSADPVRPS